MGEKVRIALAIAVVVAVTFALREVVTRFVVPAQTKTQSAKPADPKTSPFHIASAAIGNKIDGEYTLIDQDGRKFEMKEWFDKPIVVSFIFTNCAIVCPAITSSLSRIVKDVPGALGKDFRVLSVSFDTAKDTPDVMRKFGKNFIDDFTDWKFVTGPEKDIKALADRMGIVFKADQTGGFLHTVGVTVVGPGGKVSAQVFGPQYSNEDILRPVEEAIKAGK